MIDLHYWPTPNGKKISIFLEETGTPYRVVPVNIGAGEQFSPQFLAISPNNRMPAIVDHEPADKGAPIAVFESAAILEYLADKTGQLIAKDVRGRVATLEWLAWQVAGLGPMMGQAGHFRVYAKGKSDYAEERYTREVGRLFGVMDRRLAEHEYLADAYSIADIACYPWVAAYPRASDEQTKFPNLTRWSDAIAARPAVQRGMAVGKELSTSGPMDEKARKILFEQK